MPGQHVARVGGYCPIQGKHDHQEKQRIADGLPENQLGDDNPDSIDQDENFLRPGKFDREGSPQLPGNHEQPIDSDYETDRARFIPAFPRSKTGYGAKENQRLDN